VPWTRSKAHVTFHDLRHAFASRAASRGVPVGVLSAILGHANVGITQGVYIHLYGREEAEQQYREAMASDWQVTTRSNVDHPGDGPAQPSRLGVNQD
jgi:integrase